MQDALVGLRGSNAMPQWSPTARPPGYQVWRYEFNDTPFPILRAPEIDGPLTGEELQPGQLFHVSHESRGADGALYLKLLNGDGWVYEKIPFFPTLCVRQDDTGAQIFDMDEACNQMATIAHPAGSAATGSKKSPESVRFTFSNFKFSAPVSSFQALAAAVSSQFHCMRGCCREMNSDPAPCPAELQMQLSIELASKGTPSHELSHEDSYDITFASRSFGGKRRPREPPVRMSPREADFRRGLELPELDEYPSLPDGSPGDRDGAGGEMGRLLEIYRDFALELHTGLYLTQLTANRDYADIHCQLVEDMMTLRVDQSSGRIIEFPLTDVAKLYKTDFQWFPRENPVEEEDAAEKELIVMVVFLKRRIAFVFNESTVCQRFYICIDLLIQRAWQKQEPLPDGRSPPCPSPRHRPKVDGAESQLIDI